MIDRVENKIPNHDLKRIKQLIKENNILSSEKIQQKDYQGIKVSKSSIRWALKARKYEHKNRNITAMFIYTNQKKAWKELIKNYIDTDYTKMIFTDESF